MVGVENQVQQRNGQMKPGMHALTGNRREHSNRSMTKSCLSRHRKYITCVRNVRYGAGQIKKYTLIRLVRNMVESQ